MAANDDNSVYSFGLTPQSYEPSGYTGVCRSWQWGDFRSSELFQTSGISPGIFIKKWSDILYPYPFAAYVLEIQRYQKHFGSMITILECFTKPHSFEMPIELRNMLLVALSDIFSAIELSEDEQNKVNQLFSTATPQTGLRTKGVIAKKEDNSE